MSNQYPPPPPPPGPPGPPPPGGWGAPGYGWEPPAHPQATTALVLGIVSLVLCQLLGPVAWVVGGRAVKEIDASGGVIGGRSNAQTGRILGMVATGLMALGLLAVIGVLAVGTIASTSFNRSCTTVTNSDGLTETNC